MRHPLQRTWRSALRVLALVMAIAVIPLPALAGDESRPAATPGIRVSAAKVAATVPLAKAAGQATAQGTRPEPASTSFFSTPAGIAVLGVVAAGVGYAVYSARHDRIHSVTRAAQ